MTPPRSVVLALVAGILGVVVTMNGVEGNTAVQTMFGGKIRDAGP